MLTTLVLILSLRSWFFDNFIYHPKPACLIFIWYLIVVADSIYLEHLVLYAVSLCVCLLAMTDIKNFTARIEKLVSTSQTNQTNGLQ